MSTIYGVGDCVKDVFRVETILEGGMGVVYICRVLEAAELRPQVQFKSRKQEESPASQSERNPYIAFKTFHRELIWHPSVEEGFRRECLTWITLLPHPNIVKAKTTDLIGAYLHLWLEFIDGGSLRERISGRTLSLEEALSIALQFCVGMEFLYESGPIIHLDIKPENILLTKAGVVKITDFGLAKALVKQSEPGEPADHEAEDDGKSGGPVVAGTVPYMSPEQFAAGELDVRSDIYGFGVVFYEMMTGRRPFEASEFEDYKRLHQGTPPAPAKTIRAVPERIDGAILKCLEKRPEKRWQTFTELRLELETFCRENGMDQLITAAPSLASLEQSMNASDWNGRGYALAKLDRFEESLLCYRKSLEMDPEGVGANINMGTGLKRIGRKEEALAYFEREVELHPDVAIAYEPLANHYMEMGRGEDALAAMRKSAELDREAIARWRTLGFMCLKLKRGEESRKVWEHIKELLLTVPRYRNPMSVNNEVIIRMNMGATEQALDMHEFGVEHYPESALIWYNFGITLHQLGYVEQAIGCYSRALDLDNSLTFASLNRALLLLGMGHWESAKQDLESTVASDPESVAAGFAKTLLDTASQVGIEALGMLSSLGASLKYIM
jgi:serine/threonine protein kinase